MLSYDCWTYDCLCCSVFLFILFIVFFFLDFFFFFFQAEDGIRDLVRSRGLGDVYKRQPLFSVYNLYLKPFSVLYSFPLRQENNIPPQEIINNVLIKNIFFIYFCLLYTSDAADERSSVDLGGRRIIKTKKHNKLDSSRKQ